MRAACLLILLVFCSVSAVLAGEPPQYPIIRITSEMHSARMLNISADAAGRVLATASADKTVKLWDVGTGKLLRTLRPPIGPGVEGNLIAVAVSPDGKTVAAGGYTGDSWDKSYSVYLFDADSGELRSRIPGFNGPILRLAYSYDGKRLAVSVNAGGGFGNGIHVYNAADNSRLFSDTKFNGFIYALDFASNGNLAAASYKGELRIYRQDGSIVSQQISKLGEMIWNIKFSPDGQKLAVSYEFESRNEVDVLSGIDGSWQYSLYGIKGGLQSISWSHDGRYILVAGGKSDSSGNKILHRWSVNSRSVDETIVLPSKSSIRQLLSLKDGSAAFLSPLSGFGVVAPEGASSSGVTGPVPKIKSEELSVKKEGVRFYNRIAVADFQKNHDAFKITPDASTVMFSYERYGQAKAIFDLKQRRLITTEIPEEGLIKPILTADGLDIQNWDSNTAAVPKLNRRMLKDFGTGWEYSSSVAVRPDGQGFILGTSHYLRRYDRKGALVWKQRTVARAWDVNISSDSKTIVAALDDGTIRWFNMRNGHERYALYLHPDKKRWLLWQPDGYFDHGPDSENLVGFVVNKGAGQAAEVVRVNRMYDIFYRPDIVDKVLNNQDISAYRRQLDAVGSTKQAKPPKLKPETAKKVQQEIRKSENDTDKQLANEKQEVERLAKEKVELERKAAEKLKVSRKVSAGPPKGEQNGAAANSGLIDAPPQVEEQETEHLLTALDVIVNSKTLPPRVKFVTPSGVADVADYKIAAQVCDNGGGIGDVTLFLNSMPILVETAGRSLKVVGKDSKGHCRTFEKVITLAPGSNRIQLMAFNRANTIESQRDSIEIKHPVKETLPELHVLTVAINAYRDGDLRLKYALRDANALAGLIQEKGSGLFGKVHINKMQDNDVTKAGLIKAFSDIGQKMRREDVFLLFVAGHGITDEKEGSYYFLPVDFRYTGEEALKEKAVSMADFRKMLAKIQAMKSLILLDTCNSGSFAEAIAGRGLTEKVAITKLSRAIGRATIVASSKSQMALEGYNEHGAFTWTILEGMKGRAAGQGNKIMINNLATFIEEELPKLTYKKWGYEQIPQKTLQGMDFQIGIK
jgi:WD40 repeat protein